MGGTRNGKDESYSKSRDREKTCRTCDHHGNSGLFGIKTAFQGEELDVINPVELD